uniref:EOG090X0GO7 n=1 Tax=Simocephalus serrulatus TaxID=117539 RepID=A0A4Y7NMU7_9CRUS|nr:EOG090X0GO7 [Simocephalus serrulatus]SVE94579.1 EOG090X0GO7 [Simocephalus serrulatus]
MAAKNSVKSLTRLPINITIDKEDLESDEEVPNSAIPRKLEKRPRHVKQRIELASQLDTGIEDVGVYIDVNPHKEKFDSKSSVSNKHDVTCSLIPTKADKLMEKSVLQPGFEKLECVPKYSPSLKKLKKDRKKEADKTKGDKWFGLPATEMTEEKLRDLEVIQMRSILNPKQFYKKNDLKVVPKYFQVGTVVDSPADFYHDRVPRKERKKTLVDELMANADFQRYNKRKYAEIIQTKPNSIKRPTKMKKKENIN